MQRLDLQQTADFLESATIDKSIDFGFALVHSGMSATGHKFVLVNDSMGRTSLTLSH